MNDKNAGRYHAESIDEFKVHQQDQAAKKQDGAQLCKRNKSFNGHA